MSDIQHQKLKPEAVEALNEGKKVPIPVHDVDYVVISIRHENPHTSPMGWVGDVIRWWRKIL